MAHFASRQLSRCSTDASAWFALTLRPRTDRYGGCRDCFNVVHFNERSSAPHAAVNTTAAAQDNVFVFNPEWAGSKAANTLVRFCRKMLELPCCQVDHQMMAALGLDKDEEAPDAQPAQAQQEHSKKLTTSSRHSSSLLQETASAGAEDNLIGVFKRIRERRKRKKAKERAERQAKIQQAVAKAKTRMQKEIKAVDAFKDKHPLRREWPYHGHSKCDIR